MCPSSTSLNSLPVKFCYVPSILCFFVHWITACFRFFYPPYSICIKHINHLVLCCFPWYVHFKISRLDTILLASCWSYYVILLFVLSMYQTTNELSEISNHSIGLLRLLISGFSASSALCVWYMRKNWWPWLVRVMVNLRPNFSNWEQKDIDII